MRSRLCIRRYKDKTQHTLTNSPVGTTGLLQLGTAAKPDETNRKEGIGPTNQTRGGRTVKMLNGRRCKCILMNKTHKYFHCKVFFFPLSLQHDSSRQTYLRSDLMWQIKSVISWKTTTSCISNGHPPGP